uniref:BTB domain-containing protein n=1 Tax=Globodera rostochiensis TaxID=31243 RepID=A0A914H6P5_GLORO
MVASDVFVAMFRLDEENAKSAAVGTVKEVKPVEVETGAFKVMLSFIYADDLSGLNGDNAISVLYADNFKTPAYYTGSYVIVSSLFYAAIVTKFAWIKAHNRNWGTEVAASASDKDSVRLTLTCVAIQIVAMCQMSYISANMRTNCRQLLGKVWPFTTTKVAAIDAGLNTQIRNINVNVVGSNRLAAQQL